MAAGFHLTDKPIMVWNIARPSKHGVQEFRAVEAHCSPRHPRSAFMVGYRAPFVLRRLGRRRCQGLTLGCFRRGREVKRNMLDEEPDVEDAPQSPSRSQVVERREDLLHRVFFAAFIVGELSLSLASITRGNTKSVQ